MNARAQRARTAKFGHFHKKTASLQTPYNKHSGSVFAFPFFAFRFRFLTIQPIDALVRFLSEPLTKMCPKRCPKSVLKVS